MLYVLLGAILTLLVLVIGLWWTGHRISWHEQHEDAEIEAIVNGLW